MRFIIYIGIIFCTAACTSPTPELHPGDLLFRAGRNSAMTGAITAATGRIEAPDFSHVGIFVRYDGTDAVLEAAPEGGVRISPLREFLDGSARIGGRHAAARYGRAGGLAPPGLRVSRPPLRLFLPAGQRKTLLQRAGLGELPHSGRTTALPRPADEFPGGGRFDARLLDRTVRTAQGSDPRRRTGDQPERYGARSAIVRGRPLVLKRRGGQTIRSTVMSGFARSRSIYPSSAAVPLARITSVARCTTPSGVRAASTS